MHENKSTADCKSDLDFRFFDRPDLDLTKPNWAQLISTHIFDELTSNIKCF